MVSASLRASMMMMTLTFKHFCISHMRYDGKFMPKMLLFQLFLQCNLWKFSIYEWPNKHLPMSTAMVYIMRKHLAWDPRVRGNHFLESSYHDNLRTIEMYILDGKWLRWLIPFLSSTKMADKDVAALIRLRRPKRYSIYGHSSPISLHLGRNEWCSSGKITIIVTADRCIYKRVFARYYLL